MENEPFALFGLRPLLPDAGSHKGTRDCEVVGCSKSTREGKPFCSKHIESAPYIQEILGKLAARAEEEEILDRGRKLIPQDGFFVRESILLLRTKDFTIKSFSRRLDISHKAAARLVELLLRWGHAKESKTSRGGKTISGLGDKDLVDGI